ncbi:hypothetical protein BKA93DRAFT_296301 [Sparassis latifolia]
MHMCIKRFPGSVVLGLRTYQLAFTGLCAPSQLPSLSLSPFRQRSGRLLCIFLRLPQPRLYFLEDLCLITRNVSRYLVRAPISVSFNPGALVLCHASGRLSGYVTTTHISFHCGRSFPVFLPLAFPGTGVEARSSLTIDRFTIYASCVSCVCCERCARRLAVFSNSSRADHRATFPHTFSVVLAAS